MHSLPIIIVGAGGHGCVLADALSAADQPVLGFTNKDPVYWGQIRCGIQVLGNDDIIKRYEPRTILLANGLGTIGLSTLRQDVFSKFKMQGYRFATIVHPSAIVSPHAQINEGCQIMAGAVIQAGAILAANTIINTGAIIDHDCVIGAHSHVATGVTLSGGVKIGESCHIGSGATIIQGLSIGDQCLVAAGAVVVCNATKGSRLAGIPAKEME